MGKKHYRNKEAARQRIREQNREQGGEEQVLYHHLADLVPWLMMESLLQARSREKAKAAWWRQVTITLVLCALACLVGWCWPGMVQPWCWPGWVWGCLVLVSGFLVLSWVGGQDERESCGCGACRA